MALYSKLDIVNKGLRALGQLPVNDLVTPHPGVPAILQELELSNNTAQTKRYWFNYEKTTLTPGSDKRIQVPNDVASIDTVDSRTRVAQRGRHLYNLDTGSFDFDGPVEVLMHRVLPFDDLPAVAQQYIGALALRRMQAGLDGDGVRYRELQDDEVEAYNALTAENTRNAQTNLLRRKGVRIGLYRINQESTDPFRR